MFGSPNWTRTSDTLINSQVLYRLSYGGMCEHKGQTKSLYSRTRTQKHFREKMFLQSSADRTFTWTPAYLSAVHIVRLAIFFNDQEVRFSSNLRRHVGAYLFSRAVASQVSSARQSLTSVFGMGTGGPSALITPTLLRCHLHVTDIFTAERFHSANAPSGIRTRDPLIKSQLLYQLS